VWTHRQTEEETQATLGPAVHVQSAKLAGKYNLNKLQYYPTTYKLTVCSDVI